MEPEDKVIVFFSKKARVDDLSSELALAHISCQSIHGGRDQEDRELAIEELKTGLVRILLATDVASRGLDIEDITYVLFIFLLFLRFLLFIHFIKKNYFYRHVFNYDFPRDIEEYVHRVGRTGRAGKTGESITFMTKDDWSHSKELISILEEASQVNNNIQIYKIISFRYNPMHLKFYSM